MEADISIWRKPGHFYFALTRGKAIACVEVLYRDERCTNLTFFRRSCYHVPRR